MKIALDASEAFWPPLTGTGVYTRALLGHLPPAEIVALAAQPAPGVRQLRCPRNRTLWSQLRLPAHLLTHRYDLLHVPGHKLPRYCPCPTVVTIHDLAFLKFPDTFRPAHRQRLIWFTTDAVRRSTRIIAISVSTKRDLCDLLQADPGKIDVVHHGADHSVFHPSIHPIIRPLPYILTVGALQPRKNLITLIRAFKKLRVPAELLIAGQRGWLWEPIEQEAAASRIQLLGHVPDDELADLYRGAAVVAMPSLYEGFGIPLVEAMACGAPIVAANASSFPEVLGDAGVLLDPSDEDAWAMTLLDLLSNAARQKELSERSLARAKQFTWDRTAEQTLAVYRKVLGS